MMTLKNIVILSSIAVLLSGCVSAKIHEDLKDKYDALRVENASLMSRLDNKERFSEMGLEQAKTALEKCKSEHKFITQRYIFYILSFINL